MRARIEPFGEEHLSETLRWMNDPQITENLDMGQGYVSDDQCREWFVGEKTNEYCRTFAIITPQGLHVGNCGLLDIDERRKKAKAWIILGELTSRGKGYAADAMRLLCAHAFGELGMHKVWLYCLADNEPACRLYDAVGFVREGLMRDDTCIDGRYRDSVCFAMLPSDGPRASAARKERLAGKA